MDVQTFFVATLTAHVGLAAFVALHARAADDEAGNWPYITLALGLAGLVGYFFYDPERDAV